MGEDLPRAKMKSELRAKKSSGEPPGVADGVGEQEAPMVVEEGLGPAAGCASSTTRLYPAGILVCRRTTEPTRTGGFWPTESLRSADA
jgi:hypothetical protein